MCMLYSTDRFNKQGDHIQPWLTPFPIWEQSVVLCPLLTVAFYPVMQASQKAGKLVWYSLVFKNFPQFPLIHTGKGFSRVKPVDLLIWSSAFSESSLSIGSSWFTYYWSLDWRNLSFTLLVCEIIAVVRFFWTFFGIALLWDWNENWPFPVLWPLLSFPDLLAY